MTMDGLLLDGMGSLRRTHRCGALSKADVGREVVVTGWVHRRRDHGGVIFVDLRDRDGIVQVVFRPETSPASHQRAGHLRSEWVILARGVVEARSDDTINPKMETGEVEVDVHELRILNTATPSPTPCSAAAPRRSTTTSSPRPSSRSRPPR